MSNPYSVIDFDKVTNIVELAEVFTTGPYTDNGQTNEHESYTGIMTQYENAGRLNYKNAAFVVYLDRSQNTQPEIVVRSMWFDEDGNRTERPEDNFDHIRKERNGK